MGVLFLKSAAYSYKVFINTKLPIKLIIGISLHINNAYFDFIVEVAEVVSDAVDDDQPDAGALFDNVVLQAAHDFDQILQRLKRKKNN